MKILIYILIIVGWAVKSYIEAKQKRASQNNSNPDENKNNKNPVPKEILVSQTISNKRTISPTHSIVSEGKKRKEKKILERKPMHLKIEKRQDVLIDLDSQNEEVTSIEEETTDFDVKKAFIYSEIIRPKYM